MKWSWIEVVSVSESRGQSPQGHRFLLNAGPNFVSSYDPQVHFVMTSDTGTRVVQKDG